MDTILLIHLCFSVIVLLYYISLLRIGKIVTYPHWYSIYTEPSKLGLLLKSDNRSGICYGPHYIAYYKNGTYKSDADITNNDHLPVSTIYYLATIEAIDRFKTEFYYNRPHVY